MKIVLLDDDEWFAASLANSLSHFGAEVTIENNPRAVFDLIDNNSPDVLVCDWHLGADNVMTLLNEMASYNDTLALPKIILSASGRAIKLEDIAAFGVKFVFDKSTYNLTDLKQAIWGLPA